MFVFTNRPQQNDTMKKTRKRPAKLIVGWRETVVLPDLGLPAFKAKLDTGARTTAIHANHISVETIDGQDWVTFHPCHMGLPDAQLCRMPLHAKRAIKNTSGVPQERLIIRTRLHLADRKFLVDLSLADRGDMTYPMIIGRTAIRGHRLLVDSGRSFLTRPTE